MVDKTQYMVEAYQRGILPKDRMPVFEEAVRRNLIPNMSTVDLKPKEIPFSQSLPDIPKEEQTEKGNALPNYMAEMLKKGDTGEQDKERLMSTGITPGTAPEWASAHIQDLKGRGIDVNPRRQEAIFDLYKQQAGRTDLSNQNFLQQAKKYEREARGETILGRLRNAKLSAAANLGETAYDLIGAIAPEWAESMSEEYTEYLNANLNSASGTAGTVFAELGKVATFGKTGAKGMAGIYGTQGFGGVRREVVGLEKQGKEISLMDEYKTAIATGTTEAVSGYISGRIFQKMSGTLRNVSPTFKKLLMAGDKGAVKKFMSESLGTVGLTLAEGTEEAAAQLITNKIRQWGINPEIAIAEGVVESFAMGAILSPFGALGASRRGDAPSQKVTDADNTILGKIGEAGTTRPITEVNRLLEAKTTEQQVTEMREQGVVGAEIALELPAGEGVITVSPTGEAITAKQQRGIEQAGQDVAERITQETPLALPAPTRRFDVTPEGQVTDLTDPNAERRTPEGAKARAKVEQLTAEGRLKEAEVEIVRLKKEARTDELTGLGNKRAWNEGMTALKEDVDKTGVARPFAFLDMANLKIANDVLSHEQADVLFVNIANELKKHAGEKAIITRQGGDEFGIIFPKGTSQRKAKQILADAEAKMEIQTIIPGELSMFLAGAVGTYHKGDNLSKQIEKADKQTEVHKDEIKERLGEPLDRSVAEGLAKVAKGKTAEPELETAITPERQRGAAQTPEQIQRAKRAFRRGRQQAQKIERKAKEVENKIVETTQKTRQDPPLKGTKYKGDIAYSIESGITPIDSRIKKISPRIFDRLQRMESNTLRRRAELKANLNGIARRVNSAMGRKSSHRYKQWKKAVLEGREDDARQMMPKDIQEDFTRFYTTFRTLFNDMRAEDITVGDQGTAYWPRTIRRYKHMRKLLRGDDVGKFDEALRLAQDAKGGKRLNEQEKIDVLNATIQGYGPRKPGAYGIPATRTRRMDVIPDSVLGFYADPIASAYGYIDGITYAIERSRFLGKGDARDSVSINESVGAVVEQELVGEQLSAEQQSEVQDLLNSRFLSDTTSTHPYVRTAKQLIYMATLGQLRSAITQLTDTAITASEHGIVSTGKAVAQQLHLTSQDRKIMMEELGLDSFGTEFQDVGKLAEVTNGVMTSVGFKRLDRFGKEVRMNAARIRFENAAANPSSKDYQRLRREYEPVMGAETFQQTMKDFREGNKTEDTGYMTFLDITKIQPLTPSQMPKKYLDHPNGRIVYTLKSFTIKQLDYVRREMLQKLMTPGQRTEGLKHLSKYVLFFSLFDFGKEWIKDWMHGRTIQPQDLPDRVVDSLLSTVGMHRYLLEQTTQDPVMAVVDYFTPPHNLVSDPVYDVFGAGEGLKTIRNIPIVGELVYNRTPFGRGYHLNKERAKSSYRKMLRELRDEASDARLSGDLPLARQLLMLYNDKQRENEEYRSRKTPLTMSDLLKDARKKENE